MSGLLQGRVALVTGAASGIGQATAAMLRDQGASVAGLDRKDFADGELCLVADVSDEAQVGAAFATAEAALGPIDVSINCAGIMVEQPTLEMSPAEFEQVIKVNLTGTFVVGRCAIGCMRAGSGVGRVINVASDLAYIGRANYAAYCASKAGVIGLTRAWAHELAPDILVNAIAPGPVDTPMLSLDIMSPEALASETENPLGRIGQPREIAATIAFLAGPGAGFITGQTFGPNGGSVMP